MSVASLESLKCSKGEPMREGAFKINAVQGKGWLRDRYNRAEALVQGNTLEGSQH